MMSAPQPPGGREPEASASPQGGFHPEPSIGSQNEGAATPTVSAPTQSQHIGAVAWRADAPADGGTSDIKWIEPVFDTDVTAEEEQRHGTAGKDDALDPAPAPETGTAEAATPNSTPGPARSRRGRRSSASPELMPKTASRSVKAPARRSARQSSAPPARVPTGASPAPTDIESALALARITRLDGAIGAERAAAASALAAYHGTLAASALAALHDSVATERELAIARIIRLGAERAAAAADITPGPGSRVAHPNRVADLSDATSFWTAISLLWHRDGSSRRSMPAVPVSALILAPGGPDYVRRTGTELSVWREPDAKRPRASRRRLIGNALALLVVMAAVATYFSSDFWPASARQTPAVAANPAVPAAAPAVPPSDPVRRIAYFQDRAEAGDATAQYSLGVLYAQGDGVEQNYASAASWFRKAASGGIVNAQDLAALYERGLATPQDFVVAAYWYRNAAERGIEAAMLTLALLYERGQGLEASPIDAYAWYRAAARRGDAIAGKRAAALFEQLGGAEKARAVVRAAEIVDTLHEPRAAPSGSATLMPGDWVGLTTTK
jgi:Sel1 repeat